jgi:hypothetical protein
MKKDQVIYHLIFVNLNWNIKENERSNLKRRPRRKWHLELSKTQIALKAQIMTQKYIIPRVMNTVV